MSEFHRLGANHTCFTCGYFRGVMGTRANCAHTKLPPIHDLPEQGCKRWAFDPTANRDVWTLEDWHVLASDYIPGYEPAPMNTFRAPLTNAAIHRLHATEPSHATTAMAWEIARLHDALLRVRNALMALREEKKMPMSSRVYLRRMAERLLDEPGVRAAVEKAGWKDSVVHRGD